MQQDEPKQWDALTQANLQRIFNEFFIDNLNENIRKSSLQLLSSLWVTGNYEQKKYFYELLLAKCENLLKYGKNNEEIFQLFQFICNKQSQNQEFKYELQQLFQKLLQMFQKSLQQLIRHPDHQLYLFLEDIVDDYKTFKPSYFEVNGCLICYGQYQQNTTQTDKLSVIQQEIRPTQNRLIIKLKKTMEIQQIILPKDPGYVKNKKSYMKQINIYINNNLSSDMNSLKNDMNLWKKTKTVNITQDNKEQTAKDYQIMFPIPITAKFICLEFILNGKLPSSCQRCPEVRGEGSGLFCNQCQWSPLIQVESTHFIYKANSFTEALVIDSDKSKENCELAIQDYNKVIYDLSQELLKEKYKMKILYDRYHGTKCVNSSGILLNSDDLNGLYQDLMSNMNALISYKKALAQYSGISMDNLKKQIIGMENCNSCSDCYGCLYQFIYTFLNYMTKKEIILNIQDENSLNQLQKTLEVLVYKSDNQYQEKIVIKSICLHKTIQCVKFNQETFNSLNFFLQQSQEEFLNVNLDLNESQFQFYKLKLLDIKNFLSVLKDQMQEDEPQKYKQFNILKTQILNLVNNVMPLLLQRIQNNHPSYNTFLNNIIVPFLEIIQLEITRESPYPLTCQFQNNASTLSVGNYPYQFDKTLTNLNSRNKDLLLEQERQIQEKLQKNSQFLSSNFGQRDTFGRYNFMLSYSGLGALMAKDSQQQRDSLGGLFNSSQQQQQQQQTYKKTTKEIIQQRYQPKQQNIYGSQQNNKQGQQNNKGGQQGPKVNRKKENIFILFNIIIGQNNVDLQAEYTEEKLDQMISQFILRSDNWLQQCIKLFSSRRINEIVHFIVVQIAYFNKRIAMKLLLNALPQALENQENSIKYFELFKEVIKIQNQNASAQEQNIKKLPGLVMMHQQSSEESTLQKKELEEENQQEESEYVIILQSMFKLLDEKLQKYAKGGSQQLVFTYDYIIQNLNMGQSLNQLAILIKSLIENQKIKQIFKNNNKTFMQYIIQSVVNIRKFKYILNQNFFQIENILSTLFLELQSNNFNEKFEFLKNLIIALPLNAKNPLGQEFLMEQINKILIPKKLNVNLRLEVQANQREYLPTSLPKKDIPASEFGNTMNDILLRIKSELPDSSWVIEMLVANKLINNKDLPIDLVYKKVWIPSQLKGVPPNQIDWKKQAQTNAMKIVYRITGFDGEAHEELIDQIVDEDQLNCLALSKVLFENIVDNEGKQTCGLACLINIVDEIYKDLEQKWKLQNIITILNLTFRHSEGRYKALHYNGLNIFIKVLMKFLPNMNESEPDLLIQNMFELIHGLLDESENIKFKISKRSTIEIEEDQMVYDEEECLENVKLCINKINAIEQKGNKYKNQLVQDLIRILPILTRDFIKPSQYIVNSFEQYIEFDDQQIKKENQEKINKFMEIAEKVPEDFQSFREETINSGILNKATQVFLQIIPEYSKINQVKIKQYNTSLQRCIQIFMSLIKGNHNVQSILNKSGILHSIYQLTDPSIKIKEIGKISEDIIEYIVCEKNNVQKEVQNQILKVKQEEEQIKKEKANQVKQTQLQMLNNNAQKIKQVFDFGDLEEETSIKCVVCQEGYNLRPKDVLGAYVYSASYNIFDLLKLVYEGNSYQDKSSVTSVTSFNLIHLKCHQEAVQADQNSKKPKSEWEGALIRNSEAKCNNWFPLKGPEIEQSQIENGLKKYFKCIGQQNVSGNQATWIILNDFKGLLMKFCNQEDIAKETRTTFEHNIKILPFFISLISNQLIQNDQNDLGNKVEGKVDNFLNNKQKEENNRKIEALQLYLTTSLFLYSYQQWKSKSFKLFFNSAMGIFVPMYFKNNVDMDARIGKYAQPFLIQITFCNFFFNKIHGKALNQFQGNINQLNEKIDIFISHNIDTLIEQFQQFYIDYRDKITKFTKVSEYLEFCEMKQEIQEDLQSFNLVFDKFKE